MFNYLLTLGCVLSNVVYRTSDSLKSGNRTRKTGGFFMPNVWNKFFTSGVGEYNTFLGNKPAVLVGCFVKPPIYDPVVNSYFYYQ